MQSESTIRAEQGARLVVAVHCAHLRLDQGSAVGWSGVNGGQGTGQTCDLQQGPAAAMEVDCWGWRQWEQGHGALTR